MLLLVLGLGWLGDAQLQYLTEISVGGGPRGVFFDENTLYVAVSLDNVIAKFPQFLVNPSNVTFFSVPNTPFDIAKSNGDGTNQHFHLSFIIFNSLFFRLFFFYLDPALLVSQYESDRILILDVNSGQVLESWIVGTRPTYFSSPVDDLVYIPAIDSDYLVSFNSEGRFIERTYRTGRNPTCIHLSISQGRLLRQLYRAFLEFCERAKRCD